MTWKKGSRYILGFGILLVFTPDTLAKPKSISVIKWKKNISKMAPQLFCHKDWYIRQCFTLTKNKCHRSIKSSTQACLKKIPNKRTIASEKRAKYGLEVGKCIGISYFKKNKKHLIKSNKLCGQPNRWFP